MTVMPRTVVEAFLPETGAVDLSTVYQAATTLGIADQPLRLAVRRMIAAGLVIQTGRGRSGTIALTESGRERLERDRAGLELARQQDAGTIRWDKQWRLIAISVPERDRPIRDAIRRELLAAGAANLATALFISPHDLTGMLDESVHSHLVTATATDLTVRGQTEPVHIAEMLWPAAPIIAGYEPVEHALRDDNPTEAASARKLRLADALERAIRHDPLLPPELRAASWPPTRLRTAWSDRWNGVPNDGTPQPYAD